MEDLPDPLLSVSPPYVSVSLWFLHTHPPPCPFRQSLNDVHPYAVSSLGIRQRYIQYVSTYKRQSATNTATLRQNKAYIERTGRLNDTTPPLPTPHRVQPALGVQRDGMEKCAELLRALSFGYHCRRSALRTRRPTGKRLCGRVLLQYAVRRVATLDVLRDIAQV